MKSKRAISAQVQPVVMWPLCLFCIFQKSIDVFFKCLFVGLCIVVSNFFAVNNRHAFKRHIVMIALYVYFSTSGTAIAEPCPIKKFTAIPRNEVSEFCNGGLKIRECLFQSVINGISFFGPFGGDRIKSLKFGQKNISEISGGSSKPIQTVVESGEIRHNKSHDKTPRYLWDMSPCEIDQVLHDFEEGIWYGLIISILFLFFT